MAERPELQVRKRSGDVWQHWDGIVRPARKGLTAGCFGAPEVGEG